jgi:hypothetical protein
MRDLGGAVVELDPAADDAFATDRVEARQIVAFDVEIDEREDACAICAHNPVGATARAWVMRFDTQLQGCNPTRFERLDLRGGAAIDDAGR